MHHFLKIKSYKGLKLFIKKLVTNFKLGIKPDTVDIRINRKQKDSFVLRHSPVIGKDL